MGRRWLALGTLMAVLGGCTPADDGQPATVEPQAGAPWVDEFNLPLIIRIEAPDVPPEIQNPSSPIKDKFTVSSSRIRQNRGIVILSEAKNLRDQRDPSLRSG